MTPDTDIHLELYVRTQPPAPIAARLDSLRSTLQTLADARGWTVGVTEWPTKIELTGDAPAASVVEHVHAAFDDWATQAGVSLDPAFQTRDCYSWRSGEPCEALVLPVACLAVSRDDDLESVYPHRDEEGMHTIPDAIERLESTPSTAEFDTERTVSKLTP